MNFGFFNDIDGIGQEGGIVERLRLAEKADVDALVVTASIHRF